MPSAEDADTTRDVGVPSAPGVTHPAAADGDPLDGSTGDAAVDEALSRLAELDRLPVREHVHVLETLHAALQDRLADVED